ncbi:SNX7 isoform 5 [Pan troglodytes]|uniref:Sorting nexin 7 n=2 Tax=Homininae TaxID=207598 RepID=E9PLE1_HUMAN|nr:SNX7 isoform 5 [Pan troglodytes]
MSLQFLKLLLREDLSSDHNAVFITKKPVHFNVTWRY